MRGYYNQNRTFLPKFKICQKELDKKCYNQHQKIYKTKYERRRKKYM